MTDFQREWAQKNKSPKKASHWFLKLIPALVWGTCILTATSGLTELPNAVYNLTVGLNWLLALTMLGVCTLITVVTPLSFLTALGLRAAIFSEVEEAKETYHNLKSGIADKMLPTSPTKLSLGIVALMLKIGMLFMGGAWLTGSIYAGTAVWMFCLTNVDKALVQVMVAKAIQPDTIAWVETPALNAKTPVVVQVQETKALPAKKKS